MSRIGIAESIGEDDQVVLGVLLAIPAPYADQLADSRARAGDPQAALVRPHVTLVPPTPVPARCVPEVIEGVRRRCAALEPFEMRLQGTGSFRPVSDVVFVAVSEGIAQCEVLVDALSVGPLDAPRQFPFHPHVTIAQDVDPGALDAAYDELAGFRAEFVVTEVAMLRQHPDGSWTPVTTCPLGRSR